MSDDFFNTVYQNQYARYWLPDENFPELTSLKDARDDLDIIKDEDILLDSDSFYRENIRPYSLYPRYFTIYEEDGEMFLYLLTTNPPNEYIG